MTTKIVKKGRIRFNRKNKVTVTSEVPDYGNDPFFIKQADKAKENLDKSGFPDISSFLKK